MAAVLGEAGLSDRVATHRPGPGRPLDIRWASAEPAPRLSVLIASRDNPDDLGTMVESLFARADRPQGLEIVVVDNGSRTEAGKAMLAKLADRAACRCCRATCRSTGHSSTTRRWGPPPARSWSLPTTTWRC
ncbi:glycosyltransferase [Methylobrevis pamukkalensis]|uniref:glycosyltransferase n=1 Tax=Methylobrevis pamukkalensis TaxID=1439726 RepID=UPI00114C969A|nr:glycosyltransferase [Methylobrevis pamukkalensis]